MTSKLLSQAIGLSGTTGNSTNITLSSNGSLQLAANNGTDIFISANDNIGFGNTTPVDKLSIQGSLYTSSNTVTIGTGTYFVANGNIGIGTNSPAYKLDIQSSSAAVLRIKGTSSDTQTTLVLDGYASGGVYRAGRIDFKQNTATLLKSIVTDYYQTGNPTMSVCDANGAIQIHISNSGNMGIGTDSPSFALEVASGSIRSAGALVLGDNSANNGIHITNDGSATGLRIWKGTYGAGSFLAQISSNGNIGIGTNTPAYKFQIGGNGGWLDNLVIFNEASNWTNLGGTVVANYYNATTLIGGIKISSESPTSGIITFHSGGTSEKMRIDNTGRVTKPNQPNFWVSNFTWSTSVQRPSNGTVYHNVGSHYNNTNGIFTAPIAGYYMFICTVQGNNPGEISGRNATYFNLVATKNGSTVGNEIVATCQESNGTKHDQITHNVIIYLNANDTFYFNSNYGFRGVQNSYIGYLLG